MALIKCPECGREISSFASVCLGCGCPQALFADKNNSIFEETPLLESNLNVGDTIKFGSYPQEENIPRSPIVWRVLERKGDQALLISEYALDCQPYKVKFILDEAATWETCSLRKWLNAVFLNAAFLAAERKRIISTCVFADENPLYASDPGNTTMDKIFLLSIKEAKTYFASNDARICKPTKFTEERGAWVDDSNGNCDWWLRSPGDDNQIRTAIVNSDGSITYYGCGSLNGQMAVRPAMWVTLEL